MQVLKTDVRATRSVNTSSIRERIDASKFYLNWGSDLVTTKITLKATTQTTSITSKFTLHWMCRVVIYHLKYNQLITNMYYDNLFEKLKTKPGYPFSQFFSMARVSNMLSQFPQGHKQATLLLSVLSGFCSSYSHVQWSIKNKMYYMWKYVLTINVGINYTNP